jgi:hypothetical protein
MTLNWILAAQTVLILGLDLFLPGRLNLWLLYFLPLLGTARTPSIRITSFFGFLLSFLILAGGLLRIGQLPWMEIFVPRLLAVYALALTAVLILRGKQFGERAMQAVSEAAQQPGPGSVDEVFRKEMELIQRALLRLSDQLREAHLRGDLSKIGTIQTELAQLQAALSERTV